MRVIRNLVFIVAFVVCTGVACASDAYAIKSLSKALAALASDVDPTEAELASETAHTTAHLLESLVTSAPPRDREVEAEKRHAKAIARFGTAA